MSFLGALADQISSKYSLGENKTNSLDAVVDGEQTKYGSLGDFAKQFDQSAERRYLEEGYLRKDPYNTDPKQLEILMQEPDATVIVKKRMFASLGDNFRPDFMDRDEKLYYKAMKVLFQNKCRQIAALEKLSKIQRISSAAGNVNDQLMPILFTLTEDAGISSFPSSLTKPDLFGSISENADTSKFTQVMDRVRRLYGFNRSTNLTTWTTDSTNLFQAQFGQGNGVIEITNFTNLSTTVTNDIDKPGQFSLNITDPYGAMVITEYDIEKALSDATNVFNNHKIFQFGQETADQLISDLQIRLSGLRAERHASPISFKVNPDTLLGKRITAIIDRLGIELPFDFDTTSALTLGLSNKSKAGNTTKNGVSVPDEYIKDGAALGPEGLNTQKKKFSNFAVTKSHDSADSEFILFTRLIAAIYNKLSLDANSKNAFQTSNKNTNYARKKLRFQFCGKLLIQPMDSVHIYINSKSKYDNHLLGGLRNMFTGATELQAIGSAITDVTSQMTSLFNPGGDVNFQMEKSVFVGPEFPNFLWSIIRPQFINEREGTHIFAGLVNNATETFSAGDGKFTVAVQGSDNGEYLSMGKVNFKPGIDNFNGSIFDPMTPFKSRFDSVTSNFSENLPQLLYENEILMGSDSKKKSLVKFKLGPNAGQNATVENYIQDVTVDPVTKQFTRTFFAPDGLVYKWKEGIGVFVQFGSSTELNNPARIGNPAITADPFAGQDVMNVISLLITGTPYNFATYWKTVQNFDGAARDPQSKQDSAHSFYSSITNELTKNNTLWGNFIPFKNLEIDQKSYAKTLSTLFTVTNSNSQIETKLKELSDLQNKALLLNANIFDSPDNLGPLPRAALSKANNEANEISTEINRLIEEVNKQDLSKFTIIGDEVSFDVASFTNPGGDKNKESSDAKIRRNFRRQLNYLTRRLSYNVRGNEDKNLFIVDDFYDKDFDIAAFNQALGNGLKLYDNDFNTVKSKIKITAQLLNLEVFCDTQGHIRVRPPQYNRMPSSVFYKMMQMKKAMGIQVFPQFLDDLFSTQLKTLKTRLEIIEDEIRLDCASLNMNNDTDIVLFIGENSLSSSFGFISSPEGMIADISEILKEANPDNSEPKAGGAFDFLTTQASSNENIFTSSARFSFIKKSLAAAKDTFTPNNFNLRDTVNFDTNLKINELITRIDTKSGVRKSRKDFLYISTDPMPVAGVEARKYLDVFKITSELGKKLSERQKVIKLFYNAVKSSVEYRSLDDNSDTANQLLVPGNYGNKEIPEVFEHMIEDESYDDYGPNSGSRYIIKNSQIKSYSFTENPPSNTMVQVSGVLNPFAPNGLPEGLNSFPSGGNGMVTAAAVDYDMWRMYGLKELSPINVPFLSDPQSQCAPYATSILSRARQDILRGNLTISGNEFMQPGEVIFIECKGLLFYVTEVAHEFTFGGSFTTKLTLAYGHVPGEYIPTTLDVIGKALYNNKEIAGYQVQRQTSSFNESSFGVIISDPNNLNGLGAALAQLKNPTVAESPGGPTFGPANATTINNILYNVQYMITTNSSVSNNVKASLELRVYYDDSSSIDSSLLDYANEIKKIMIGESTMDSSSCSNQETNKLTKNDVQIINVNLSNDEIHNSPSQKAWDAARNLVDSNKVKLSTSTTPTSEDPTAINKERGKLRTALFSYIIDCWVKFDIIPPTTGT